MLEDRTTPSKRVNVYNGFIDDYLHTGDEMALRCRWFSPWSRFFRLEMIRDNDILFDEIKYSNDALFAVNTGTRAKKIAVRDETYLCVTESKNSLTSNYLNKPGELKTRADAFFRAQLVVHDHGYPVHESVALRFLRSLLLEDKKPFVLNFNRMREMGYKKRWLVHELFKGHSRKARIKRTVYAYLITGF